MAHSSAYDNLAENVLVSKVVFYLLTQVPRDQPLRKGDIFKAAGVTGKERTLQEAVWARVQKTMLKVFGIKMMELFNKNSKQSIGWILSNAVNEDPENSHMSRKESDDAHHGLLFAVLAVIYMNNGVIKEEDLFKFLAKLGVTQVTERASTKRNRGLSRTLSDDEEDDDEGARTDGSKGYFKNIRELIFKEWASKQHWLEFKKLDNLDAEQEQEFEIRWGPRAEAQIRGSHMLALVANVYGCEPKDFKNIYERVRKEESLEEIDKQSRLLRENDQ